MKGYLNACLEASAGFSNHHVKLYNPFVENHAELIIMRRNIQSLWRRKHHQDGASEFFRQYFFFHRTTLFLLQKKVQKVYRRGNYARSSIVDEFANSFSHVDTWYVANQLVTKSYMEGVSTTFKFTFTIESKLPEMAGFVFLCWPRQLVSILPVLKP